MKHYLNNQEIAPRNIQTFGLTSQFGGDPRLLEVDADKLILPREAKQIIETHIQSNSIFEGIPYRIELEYEDAQGNDQVKSLEYYVDLMEKPVFRDHEIEVKIKKRGAKDNFFDRAKGTSFELMAKKGVNFSFDEIPYVVVKDNQLELLIMLSLSTYTLTKELIQAVKDLVETVTTIIDSVTPEVGAGVTTDPAEIGTLVVKAAAQLVYTASILVAVIKMAQRLKELIFPKVRYLKACKIKELVSKGCDYLGFEIQSTLLDSLSQATILPVPLVKEKKGIVDYIANDLDFSFTKGYPTAQDSTPTLHSLIEAIEIACNARTTVSNGVVRIERRDFVFNQAQNQILPALNIQDERKNEYTLNTEESWRRSYIRFQVDYADFHTVDFFDPTDAEHHVDVTNVTNPDLVTLKGLNDISIPFALGRRKDTLSVSEEVAKTFFELVDQVTSIFGGGTNFAQIITDRIGILQIGQQYYSKTKLLWAVNGKQPENYIDHIGALAFYNKFHKINEIQNNDFKIFQDVPVRMRPLDFVNLLESNFAEIDGKVCELLRIRYNDEDSKAIIAYKYPFDYADGKVNTVTLND